MKILYIHMAALGDGIMASPAFRLLKNGIPDAELHVLARTHVVNYFRSLSSVDEVVPFAAQKWLNRAKPYLIPGAAPEFFRLLGRLRREKFDACLQWRGQFIDTFMSRWAGAPIRIAAVHEYHRKSPLPVEKLPFLMTDLVRLDDPYGHVIDSMVAPVARLIETTGQAAATDDLRMEFPIDQAGRDQGQKFLADNDLRPGGFACVSFSSKTEANAWPAERFAAVADHLFARHGLPVVLDGLPIHNDREDAIARSMKSVPIRSAGKLSLGGIAEVISAARLLVSFNSAPMHLASAFGVPAVVIGGRDGAATRPWKVPHEVVTHNRHFPHREPLRSEWPQLIAKVEAVEIIAAIDRVLALPVAC